jgi:hypothetical protein
MAGTDHRLTLKTVANEISDFAAVTAEITADSNAVTPAERPPIALWLPAFPSSDGLNLPGGNGRA